MRILGTALVGAALALPLTLSVGPAHAQQNLLGQAQRLLGNGDNNNNSEAQQRAYEQGREDQQRQAQQRWREEHADRAYSGQRYGQTGQQPAEGYGRDYNTRPPSSSYNGNYQGGGPGPGPYPPHD